MIMPAGSNPRAVCLPALSTAMSRPNRVDQCGCTDESDNVVNTHGSPFPHQLGATLGEHRVVRCLTAIMPVLEHERVQLEPRDHADAIAL